jgi:dienelactone hydrolase
MARSSAPSVDKPTLEYLSHPGPHRIASGDLASAGIPGSVFAPVTGRDLPVLAFGHGWMQPVHRYASTLRYLASWGFVVVAPATERGPVPSYSGLGADLSRSLRAITSGRLAGGVVTGSKSKLGVIGHSLGGGAAVLAAAADHGIKAVVTVTPAATKPALQAAGTVTAPGLHLVGDADPMSDHAGAEFARSWAGPVQLREVKGAKHLGLAEGKHWTTALTGDGAEKRIQQATRTIATAFFLRHLAGQEQLADELESKVSGTSVIGLDDPKDD